MSRNPQFHRNEARAQTKREEVNLVIVKVVRNVLASISIDVCTIPTRAIWPFFSPSEQEIEWTWAF
jgi:hypothetical protein